jgi:RNA polymerase sigma factor (sigma-70 family)
LAAVPSIGRAARVEGAAAPEADLTRALYEQYANQIFRYCMHQLGSREEAEDAVQSTFLNAFRGLKRGVVPELESAWLFKIAHNVCLSRRRSSWRRGRIESPTDFDVAEELTPAPSRRADELIGLQDALEQMPEAQRRAILLREWQGLSYREIADELELSQAAVETLIFRARRSLASGLEQPPEPRRRIARSLDWGTALTGLKSLLVGGTTAAKIAATVAAVSATTVVATEPVIKHHLRHAPAPVRSLPHAQAKDTPASPKASRPVASAPAPAAPVPAVHVAAAVPAPHPHRTVAHAGARHAKVARTRPVHGTVAFPPASPVAVRHDARPVTPGTAPRWSRGRSDVARGSRGERGTWTRTRGAGESRRTHVEPPVAPVPIPEQPFAGSGSPPVQQRGQTHWHGGDPQPLPPGAESSRQGSGASGGGGHDRSGDH